jgi:hypothetical protein
MISPGLFCLLKLPCRESYHRRMPIFAEQLTLLRRRMIAPCSKTFPTDNLNEPG